MPRTYPSSAGHFVLISLCYRHGHAAHKARLHARASKRKEDTPASRAAYTLMRAEI